MAVKTVALDAEAYALLRRRKRQGETFSEAVKRLAGTHRTVLDFVGIWRDVPAADFETFERWRIEGRRRDRERLLRLLGPRE